MERTTGYVVKTRLLAAITADVCGSPVYHPAVALWIERGYEWKTAGDGTTDFYVVDRRTKEGKRLVARLYPDGCGVDAMAECDVQRMMRGKAFLEFLRQIR